jgi:hypothetical protein
VACPLHKKTFSLETGQSLQGEEFHVRTFPVKVEGNSVYLELPPAEVLDKRLATEIGCRLATACESINSCGNGHHVSHGLAKEATNGSALAPVGEQVSA